jgi:adenosylcobinamide kinase/adenosylcobinamide-phosphate guanylyltransferase
VTHFLFPFAFVRNPMPQNPMPQNPMLPARTTLVIGGARSGKSGYAEQLAQDSAWPVFYVATAYRAPNDAAFVERIAVHVARRPAHWTLIEADHDLAAALRRADHEGGCVVIDCLTLWLTRLLCPPDADAPRDDWSDMLMAFDEALRASRGRVIVVSNEIGMGVIPMGAMTRHFVDELGRLNQRVAAICERVVLTVAGLPMIVK